MNFIPLSFMALVALGQFTFLAEVAADHPLLYIYGPLGIMCGWLMLRAEKIGANLGADIRANSAEVRVMSHRFDGVQRAMLIVELNRDSSNATAQRLIREALQKIDARDAAEKPPQK